MKRYTLLAVVAAVVLLVGAGLAAAAPGNYAPHTTSALYAADLTTTYTDGAGTVWTSVYSFLNPRADNFTDARTTIGGWTFANANRSGEVGVPIYGGGTFTTYQRNVTGQLVHTDFQLNTNSCASCHMTHTAQSRDLLFRNGIYSTCVACHDGTLGYLNVFAFPGQGNPASAFGGSIAAGTFGARYERNASVHLPNNSITIAAAPGGNRLVGIGSTVGNVDNGAGTWTSPFNCSSCHAPHGSYSIRLLHFNPNNISLRWRIGAATTHANNPAPAVVGGMIAGQENQSGGLWDDGYNMTEAFANDKYTMDIGFAPNAAPLTGNFNWVDGEPMVYAYPAGATSVAGTRFVRHVTRIWYDGFYNPSSHGGPTAGAVLGTGILNRFFDIKYGTGTITQTPAQRAALIAFLEDPANAPHSLGTTTALGAANVGSFTAIAPGSFNVANLRIDIAGVIRVTASTSGAATAANFIQPKTYGGRVLTNAATNAPYNLFCASCHTDYLMGSASGQGTFGQSSAGVGIYSKAFRHTINRGASGGQTMPVTATGNQLLCVTCHFAHGADSGFMTLSDGTLVDAPTLTGGTNAGQPNPHVGSNDINPSSALKRYVNMAVCWQCHANSSAGLIKNATWYWNGYAADGRGDW